MGDDRGRGLVDSVVRPAVQRRIERSRALGCLLRSFAGNPLSGSRPLAEERKGGLVRLPPSTLTATRHDVENLGPAHELDRRGRVALSQTGPQANTLGGHLAPGPAAATPAMLAGDSLGDGGFVVGPRQETCKVLAAESANDQGCLAVGIERAGVDGLTF